VLSGKSDHRVHDTRRALHQALIGLVRDKDYDHIAVREILERANVSRSTFYTHFGGKDDLLSSGIERILADVDGSGFPLSFGLRVFEHHDQHRRSGRMSRRGRRLLHERLRRLIAERFRQQTPPAATRKHEAISVPAGLSAQFIASTYVVVLDWWLDTSSPLTPAEANDLFLALVARAVPGVRQPPEHRE
jgi:AcrR family transcriptional regulator